MGSNPTPSAHISENCALNCWLPRVSPIGAGCRVCGCVRAAAAICGWLCRIRVEVCGSAGPSTGLIVPRDRATSAGPRLLIFASVMSHRLFDAARGLAVLAGDALGVDTQQHVHAVPLPIRRPVPGEHQRPDSEEGSNRADKPEGSGRGNREVTVRCGLAVADLTEED